nr:hypothetical protein [Micromonospora sp. DSM 115978]
MSPALDETRKIELTHGSCTCAVLTWVLLAGPVYPNPDSDRTAKFWVAIIVAVSLIDLLFKARRLLQRPGGEPDDTAGSRTLTQPPRRLTGRAAA